MAEETPATPPAATTTEPQSKPMITYDDFAKLDLRVAKVLAASEHPNADKLMVLTLDMGGGQQRQIIAGIRGHYATADMVGKEIVVVANLAPRKMRGLESNGMLLAASYGDGDNRKVIVLRPDMEVPPGSSVS